MMYVGYTCLIVAVIWIVYKVRVSYASFGGTVMVSVYDAAIFPPIVGTFGLYWVLPTFGIEWSIWIYVAIGLGLVVVVAITIRVAEDLGDRRRRY